MDDFCRHCNPPKLVFHNKSLACKSRPPVLCSYSLRRRIMFKRIDHVAIHVKDLDRSVAFYERHFGFKKYFQHAATGGLQIAYLKLGDTVLELTHKTDGAMAGFHFCLETDDFDESVARLQRDGV